MEDCYNKFRFMNRDLLKKYGENAVHSIFTDIWFCVNEIGLGDWAFPEIMTHVHINIKERGLLIPDVNSIVGPILGFVFDEAGVEDSCYDLYDDIYKIVSEVLPSHISGSEKFAPMLSERIKEEFESGDRSLTMDEVAYKLKAFPELRFLSLELLKEVMDEVYNYFMVFDEEE